MSVCSDYRPGDRVRSVKWRCTGTVRQCGDVLEVKWDDCIVSDQLELVESHLRLVRSARS